MLRYAAGENFNNDILRGPRRRDEELDVVRIQDAELSAPSTQSGLAPEGME